MLVPTKNFAAFKNIKPGELFVFVDANCPGIWCKTPFADMQDKHNSRWNDGHEGFCTAICINPSIKSEVQFIQCDPNAMIVLVDTERALGDF